MSLKPFVLNIREIDGDPSTYPYMLKVTNGSLTDNGDGTATLNITVGGITDHDALNKLAWSLAGHTIDATIDMNDNKIDNAGDITLKVGQKLYLDG